ncbi:Peripheral plasma membrane protein CASK [Liparis tanakae]|uniref:Peripheral plasma membrane protein CASK n=1 Tax=Liparis tanakae TaxID=230148 RepID=A0A4Z2I9F3_9TELE|nr:Peripheral plasma membrane protein CASK [Liparis tanakae]
MLVVVSTASPSDGHITCPGLQLLLPREEATQGRGVGDHFVYEDQNLLNTPTPLVSGEAFAPRCSRHALLVSWEFCKRSSRLYDKINTKSSPQIRNAPSDAVQRAKER